MIRFIFGVVDRLIGVSGAVLFSQAPMFINQYMQNLSGHVAELNLQIGTLRNAAETSGKTLPEYIGKFLKSPDPDFSAQGVWLGDIMDRFSSMNTSLTALQDSSLWARPLLFVRHCYLDIVEQTYREFTPGLPFSIEGIAYAVAGMLLFSSVFWIFKSGLRRLYDRSRKGSRHETPNSGTSI